MQPPSSSIRIGRREPQHSGRGARAAPACSRRFSVTCSRQPDYLGIDKSLLVSVLLGVARSACCSPPAARRSSTRQCGHTAPIRPHAVLGKYTGDGKEARRTGILHRSRRSAALDGPRMDVNDPAFRNSIPLIDVAHAATASTPHLLAGRARKRTRLPCGLYDLDAGLAPGHVRGSAPSPTEPRASH
jgi:hypothetical protein